MSILKFNEIYNKIINESEKNEGYALNITNNIAIELTQTMNEFSKLCADMIVQRNVDKDTLKEFMDLHKKIKDLIEVSTVN